MWIVTDIEGCIIIKTDDHKEALKIYNKQKQNLKDCVGFEGKFKDEGENIIIAKVNKHFFGKVIKSIDSKLDKDGYSKDWVWIEEGYKINKNYN